jgi:hypothetical protein
MKTWIDFVKLSFIQMKVYDDIEKHELNSNFI